MGTAIAKNCNVINSFEYNRTIEDPIGHLTYLKIDTKEFPADITLKSFVDESEVKVVGSVESIQWGGGATEPISLLFHVSLTNKKEAAVMLQTTLKSTNVEFDFTIAEYDSEGKKFYLSMHSNAAKLKGLIQTVGAERKFELSTTKTDGVLQPEIYAVSLGITPDKSQQSIHLAVSETQKFVKP